MFKIAHCTCICQSKFDSRMGRKLAQTEIIHWPVLSQKTKCKTPLCIYLMHNVSETKYIFDLMFKDVFCHIGSIAVAFQKSF